MSKISINVVGMNPAELRDVLHYQKLTLWTVYYGNVCDCFRKIQRRMRIDHLARDQAEIF